MRITVGSGNTRKVFECPSQSSARCSKESKIAREKVFDDLKTILFRPGMETSIIPRTV